MGGGGLAPEEEGGRGGHAFRGRGVHAEVGGAGEWIEGVVRSDGCSGGVAERLWRCGDGVADGGLEVASGDGR